MKKFIVTKVVQATPAILKGGKLYLPSDAIPRSMEPSEQGYKVIDEDGNESWCPKGVFEKAYKCSDSFLDRLLIEMRDLYAKMDKLAPFIESGKVDEVVTDKYQNTLLRLQHRIMSRYINVLECRIGRLDGSPKAQLHLMNFGEAIEVIKQGGLVRRTGWNGKGMFIFMRPNDSIKADTVVNNVKSLPHQLKEWIANNHNENEQILFTHYICMKAADGTIVNGWLASQTDMFAEDWEIVS